MDGPSLNIRIKPSRQLRTGLLCGVSLALCAPWIAAVPLSVAVALDLPVLAALVFALREGRGGGALVLRCDTAGWTLQESGVGETVHVLPDSTVWPFLTVLRLASRRGTRTLVLLPDSASREELRRLRVALRLAAGHSGREDGIHGPV